MIRITVDGDAEGGFMVEIHDGDQTTTMSPIADSPESALRQAIDQRWPSEPTSGAGLMADPMAQPEPVPTEEPPLAGEPPAPAESPPG